LVVLALQSSPLQAQPELPLPSVDTATDLIGSQPEISFIPNQGQTDARVRFHGQDGNSNLFFLADGIVFALPAAESAPATPAISETRSAIEQATDALRDGITWQLSGIQFVNPNKDVVVEGALPLPERTNFMLGSDTEQWQTDLPTYSNLLYRNLFPGIDVAYQRTAGRLKSTFYVATGADPSQIRWRYPSATLPQLDADGNLRVAIAGAIIPELVEQAPITWQEQDGRQIPVESAYRVEGDGTIGFVLGAYDPALPLVIDPTLQFNAFHDLGGASAIDVTVDSSNNYYVTGMTGSTSFPISSNPYQGTLQGTHDAFIIRYANNNTGSYNRTYSTYIGGPGADAGYSIVAGGSSVYVTGSAASGFPTPANIPGNKKTSSGLGDGFVIRLNTSVGGTAALEYSTYFGGNYEDYGISIARNGDNAFVLGVTRSDIIAGMNGYDQAFNGSVVNEDFLVLRFLTTGSTLGYASYLGTPECDFAGDIANVPNSNMVYVVGNSLGTT
jgi:hypothetical protein